MVIWSRTFIDMMESFRILFFKWVAGNMGMKLLIIVAFLSIIHPITFPFSKIHCQLHNWCFYRLLFIIEDEDQRKIVWSCIHNNLSKLLNEGQECHLETRKTLELLLLLDEANHDQITIAIKLLNKQSA